MERNAISSKAKRLETELARTRDQLRAQSAAPAQPVSFSAQMEALQQENADLKEGKGRRRRSSSVAGPTHNEAELSAVRAKLAKTERELIVASNSWMALQKTSQRDISAAEARSSDLEDDLVTLREQMQEAQTHSAALEARIATLEQQKAALESQCTTLQQLAAVKAQELESTAKEIALLQSRESALVDEIASMEEAHSLALATLQHEHDAAIESATSSSTELLSLQERLDTQTEQRKQLDLQLNVSREAAEATRVERDRLLHGMAQTEPLKAQLKELQDALRCAQQDVQNAEQRCKTVEQEFEVRLGLR
jgi:chromosome segregation ATPase